VERQVDFDPGAVVRLLGDHQVRYVLIGGLAGIAHGAGFVTQDIDICYARDAENLTRLSDALHSVNATLRGADHELQFNVDAKTIQKGDSFTLQTEVGWIDILANPSGTTGYDDLAKTADTFDLFGHRVLVASVEDLIRMKRAAGRTKDLLAVEELAALRDELDSR
jgi:hypothetical protein